MKSRATSFRKFRAGLVPAALLLVLTLGALILLSDSIQDAEHFSQLYTTLFAINILLLLVLVTLIAINVRRVVQQYRRGATGSRLTVRMVAMFLILALVPVLVVYYVSARFLTQGVEGWFDVRVEQALNAALDLSRSALDARTRDLSKQTRSIAAELVGAPESLLAQRLSRELADSDAVELVVMTTAGRVLAASGIDPAKLVPNIPEESVVLQAKTGHPYVGLDPIAGAGLHVRVVQEIPRGSAGEARLLQALYPVSARLNEQMDNVQSAYARYQELTYLRDPMRFSFLLTLSLVLLLSLLAAVWAALVSAQRLVEPIRALAMGTRAVAEGDYAKRLTPQSHDELGSLVESFNLMTQRIAQSRNEAQQSQAQAESERAYLKAVLGSLSSGVLTLDTYRVVQTANAVALSILGLEARQVLGHDIETLATQDPRMENFARTLRARLSGDTSEWQEEIVVFGASGRRVVLCRGRALVAKDGAAGGYVVVFDDVTALIQAERDAAWREVARRMAHEIKNPLTPIQLSAERLRHKYLNLLTPEEGEVLNRSTHTIIAQVEALKQMVNAFSEYARMPRMETAPLDVRALIGEVLDLYRGSDPEAHITLNLDSKLTTLDADAMRLRQLLHNLVKNALDAVKASERRDISVTTRGVEEGERSFFELCVEDSGTGIPPEMMTHLFEPYVTTKPKGTGLGLAIVKKIVEEHGGVVWAQNRSEGGARVVVRLPAGEINSATRAVAM